MKMIELASLVLLGLLFFVFPVPGTISLRDALLVLTLCVFGYLAWRRGWPGGELRALMAPAVALATLTAWMYFVAFLVSPETGWAIDEISSQWLRGLASLLAGIAAAVAVRGEPGFGHKMIFTLFIAFMLHVLYVDVLAFIQWPQDLMAHEDLSRISGLTGGADKSNYLTNILFCFLFAESLYRLLRKKRMLPLGDVLLGAAMGVALLAMLAERMRNGVGVLMLLILFSGLLWLRARKDRLKKTAFIASAAAMLAISLGGLGLAVAIKGGADLEMLVETVPLAWDTEHYKGWLDKDKYALPHLSNGQPIDISAYQRIAWMKQGLLLIRDHPLGIGFGRNAYGHGLKARYGEGEGHSHSGLLDLGIGTGIPGVLLWLGFFGSLMYLGWKRFRASRDYAAVLLMLLLLDFGARMVLDSIIRDHMLQQFMFLTGLAAVMMATDGPATRKPPA